MCEQVTRTSPWPDTAVSLSFSTNLLQGQMLCIRLELRCNNALLQQALCNMLCNIMQHLGS